MTGLAGEGPATPFGEDSAAQLFALRKTWVDPGPGISMVQIAYAWAPPGQEPDWSTAEEKVLAPVADVPSLRSAVIEVPRFLEGATDYALHHFFFVVTGDGRSTSPVFAEDVVSREVTYEDPTGEFTSVGVGWSADDAVPGPGVTNYTSMAMDGLPFSAEGTAPEPLEVYEFVRAQPLPHLFRGRLWGLRGTRVHYMFHRVRHGAPNPADDAESWADAGGAGWTIEL